jgi:hypothetical protein
MTRLSDSQRGDILKLSMLDPPSAELRIRDTIRGFAGVSFEA